MTAGILYINWRPSTAEKPELQQPGASTTTTCWRSSSWTRNSAADVDEQNALYEQAQEYIADHALAIGLYDRLSTLAVSPKLKGVWQEHAQGGPTFYDAYLTE